MPERGSSALNSTVAPSPVTVIKKKRKLFKVTSDIIYTHEILLAVTNNYFKKIKIPLLEMLKR